MRPRRMLKVASSSHGDETDACVVIQNITLIYTGEGWLDWTSLDRAGRGEVLHE